MSTSSATPSSSTPTGGHFLRSVMTMMLGTGAAQGVSILALPLITRLYDPADFGTFAVCVAAVSMLCGIASLCYQRAIPLCHEHESAVAVLLLSFGLALGVTVVATLGLWCLVGLLANASTIQILRQHIWFFPVAILLLGAVEILTMWSVRERTFSHLARSRFGQGGGLVLSQLALGFTGWGTQALLLGDAFSRAIAVGCLSEPLFRRLRSGEMKLRESLARLATVASEYRRFAVFSTPSVLLNRATAALPALLIAAFYGPGVAGCLAFAERVLGAPVTLIGESVAQVYLAEAAQLRRTQPARLQQLFLAAAWRLFLIGLVPAVVVLTAGPQLFAFAFGSEWAQAGSFAQYLALSLLLQFVISPLSHTLNVLERQDLQLLWDVTYFVLRVGGLCLAQWLSWTIAEAMLTYSAAMFIAYGLQIALISSVVLRRADASPTVASAEWGLRPSRPAGENCIAGSSLESTIC
ncbi:MAG: oligosaccharide flippase family protein [Planctomycetota bacterium]|nr:oligosaccharide flippase family protein [Planctomycetota bacterium]